MLSLRSVAKNRLGLGASFSVNRDVYGYPWRDENDRMFGDLGGNDILPQSGLATQRSLGQQLARICGDAFDVALILVGHEYDLGSADATSAVDLADLVQIQYSIQVMRDIYAQRNIGVRKIIWRRISLADAGDGVDISGKAEAVELSADWSGPAGALDVFWVQTVAGADGWSHVDGSCDKDISGQQTGVVIETVLGARVNGVLLAHEVGHYLGLVHNVDPGTNAANLANVMGDDSDGDGVGSINNNSTGLRADQAATVRKHCLLAAPR